MADITPVGSEDIKGGVYVQWAAMAAADNPLPMKFSQYADKTVHVWAPGAFGGTVTIEGSNDPIALTTPGSANWVTLTDFQGNALSFTTSGMKLIAQAPRAVRPKPGSGVSGVFCAIQANQS